ncbi:MAG: M14 family zinc carboxypeptidase, partial [Planctomycetota bacterium]
MHTFSLRSIGRRLRPLAFGVLVTASAVLVGGSAATATEKDRDAVDLGAVLPAAEFDEAIRTPAQFFGFELGSRHLRHDQLVAYSRYLARNSERVRLIPYGETHGKRPLLMLLVTRGADELNLELVSEARRKLASGQNKSVPEGAKTVAYFGYSVHGDEASAANAFPAVAYYLAAGKGPAIEGLLDNSMLLLDPALNPDGVDRFANWSNESRGRYANPKGIDREHNQPWPGGRSNYYWFDLNRDWLPTVHPESRGRIRLFHQWKPNVVLDFHEMGSTSSYFFQPGIPARNNPLTPNRVFELTRKFAVEHARVLDDANELYFSEERFDDFYMGKGSTYPDLHGAIGILFEQGSTRGLRSKNDRYDRSFAETVANQIRTSLSSLKMLGVLRDELLEHQRKFHVDALKKAASSRIRAFVLH